ncbi:ice-binding family protein [Psychroflexus sp. CAK8W]|uniref:Ice-binding family protein n=1 Tax=Psychroflexus longus TaxID=2873596 RepID=A0ABS7XHJ0_9FLAO|nr:ice-binding family protein [Psychroflexus longus]MBZ9778425.1 ice-binding family protein [Psychroflexus longus]
MLFKTLKLIPSLAVAFTMAIMVTGCADDDAEEIAGLCPIVLSTIPVDGDVDVPLDQVISVTFNGELNPKTVNSETYKINGESSLTGAVSYSDMVASFTPETNLLPFTVYTGTVTTGIEDPYGNALQQDYTWSFTTIPEVSLSVSPDASGTVTGAGLFNNESLVTVEATPNPGFEFTNWTIDDVEVSTDASYEFEVDGNMALVANFEITSFTLTVDALNGTVSKAPDQVTYDNGTEVILTATPDTGYEFSSWSGDATGADNPLPVTMDASKTVTANFTLIGVNTFTLTVNAENGTVSKNPDELNYDEGTDVILTANANSGYEFSSWSGDATGNNNPLTITMDADKVITANFTLIPINTFTLTVNAQNGTVTKNPDELNYDEGTDVILTANANSGYEFSSWSGDATGNNNPLTITMDADKVITANFTQVNAGPQGIDLNSAGDFVVLSGSGISNTGVSTYLTGDVGSFPTATITGLDQTNVDGTLYTTASPIVEQAKIDLTTAYNDGQSRTLNAISLPGQLGGLTLAPGLYENSTSTGISGTGPQGILTLNGTANDVWIFKMGSTLVTDPGTSIVLAGGAQAKNIYWIVGTSATLGTNSIFFGNILADISVTLNTGASLDGRLLTRTGSVELDSNIATKP